MPVMKGPADLALVNLIPGPLSPGPAAEREESVLRVLPLLMPPLLPALPRLSHSAHSREQYAPSSFLLQ